MKQYQSNSDKERQEASMQSEKKVEAVVVGTAKTRKKGELQKFVNEFVPENFSIIKSDILRNIIVPSLKKAVSDIVKVGIDMILYDGKQTQSSKVSYRNYYDRDNDKVRAGSSINRFNNLDYDDILFETRGDAETVLDAMNDIISQYGIVTISDLYDLARVPNDNFTLNRYGWSSISGACAIRVRDGYILKLPRAIPIN